MTNSLKGAGSIIGNTINSIVGNPRAHSPVYMQIEPTNFCNQTCVYCQRQNSNLTINDKNMPLEHFKHIIDQLKTLRILMLSGFGEPLLNKELANMVRYAKSKGIEVHTNTNLTLMTKERALELIDAGIDLIYVSIDSLQPQKYLALRQMSIEPALRGLDNLTDARKERNVLESKPKVIINCVLNRLNAEDIEDIKKIIDLAGEHKLMINLKSLQVCGTGAASVYGQIKPNLKVIKKYAAEKNVKLVASIKKRTAKPFCYRIWYGGYISAKGDLFPCCNLVKEPNFGNVSNGNFEKAWNGEGFKEFRGNLAKGDVSKYSQYIKTNCYNCNLVFNDKIHALGKYFKK